jgi:hypothetical protein
MRVDSENTNKKLQNYKQEITKNNLTGQVPVYNSLSLNEVSTMVQLANSIRSVAVANYVPFQGFDTDPIIDKVKKHLDVSTHDILLAL